MHFTFHQLKVFISVVDEGSVTNAAKKLHLTQPAVSIQLKNFQQQFDSPLTEIINNKLYVTDFGITIAETARNILLEAENIELKTREFKGLLAGKIKVSSASTGKYVIPYFLQGFLDNNPGVDLELDVTNKSRVIESLLKNEIDFALVSVPPGNVDFNEEELLSNTLYLVGSNKDESVSDRLIFREQGSATRAFMDDYFSEAPERKSLELTSYEAVKQAVIAGLGISILPLVGLKNELQNGELKIISRSDLPIKNAWRLIWLKKKNLSPAAQAFLEFVRSEKDSIIKENFSWYHQFSEEGK